MVIGARPKMGKTTLYSQLAVNCAEVEQLPALMFSLEMPDKQIVERMIGQVSRVNTDVFYADRYDDAKVAMALPLVDVWPKPETCTSTTRPGSRWRTSLQSHVASNANAALSAWCWWTT